MALPADVKLQTGKIKKGNHEHEKIAAFLHVLASLFSLENYGMVSLYRCGAEAFLYRCKR